MLDGFAGQLRAAAAEAGWPAVVLPDRSIGGGAEAWEAFLRDASWTLLENAQVALVRARDATDRPPAGAGREDQ
jgi:hypothetical protein